MGIWALFGDNFLDFQLTKSEMMRRGEKEGQKMRCNAHFFSYFSSKLGKTVINWEKLTKEAKNDPKTVFIPENTLSPKNTTFSQSLVLGDNFS